MFKRRNIGAVKHLKPSAAETLPEDFKATSEMHLETVAKDTSSKKRLLSGSTKEQGASKQTRGSVYTFERDEESVDIANQRATSTFEIDTEAAHDNRSILERNVAIGEKLLNNELEDGIYRGKGAYRPVMKVRKDGIAASKYTGLYGPIRASATNVRTTLRIDYQPDVCKDYKETGYCGFGDTCKFLHDRSDYKSGWQIEKEWEKEQAEKRKRMQDKIDKLQRRVQDDFGNGPTDDDSTTPASGAAPQSSHEVGGEFDDESDSGSENSDEDNEGIDPRLKLLARELNVPFCCLSCKRVWSEELDPVVTNCGHYFCQACAVKAYSLDMKCAKCSRTQDGILNRATAIIKLLKMFN